MPAPRLRTSLSRWLRRSAFHTDAEQRLKAQQPKAILVRILSSEGTPQRPRGSNLAQLRTILELEPDLPGLEKRWLLNRIQDGAQREALIGLLEQHGQRWQEIAFDAAAYTACWSDIGSLPEDLHPWSVGFDQLDTTRQAEVLDYLARRKHLYLLNRNGARNQAFDSGLQEAPWVFPWDGDCLLTAEAWAAIRPLLAVPELAYVAVPAAPLEEPDRLLRQPDLPPAASLPPLLGFSRAARLPFDPLLRDGPGIDQPLLQRLGLAWPWLTGDPAFCPWEAINTAVALDASRLVQAGWAWRLAVEPSVGSDRASADDLRRRQIDAIRLLARRCDMAQIGAALEHNRLRCWTRLNDGAVALPDLEVIAANARAIPPVSVSDKPERLPGSDEPSRSYNNPVPHWQSLGGAESGLQRAALLASDHPPLSPSTDRERWQLLVDAVCALALDGRIHNNHDSLAHAHRLVRTWFIDPATAMLPDGALARSAGSATTPNPLEVALDFRDLYPLLDAFTLLQQAGCFSLAECQQLEEWLDAFLSWLAQDSSTFLRDGSTSPACTWYHLLMLAIAAYRGRRNVAAQVFDNLPGLLALQFRADGSPRSCTPGAALGHAELFNLQAWANLSVLSASLGRDLLGFSDSNGNGIGMALAYASRHLPDGPGAEEQPATQWLEALLRITSSNADPATESDLPALADASCGLPPFWSLCRCPGGPSLA